MKTLLLATAIALCAEPSADRLVEHPWARFMDGSWVKTEINNPLGGSMTSKESLIGLRSGAYAVRVETEWDESEFDTELEHGFGLHGYAHADPGAERVGEESVTIDGKTFPCVVWRSRWTEKGKPYESQSWKAEDLDHPVRVRQKGEGLSYQLQIVALEEWIVVARRKFKCVRYEGSATGDGEPTKLVQWRSSEIPGGMAKTVNHIPTPEGVIQHTVEVVEFRGTPRSDR